MYNIFIVEDDERIRSEMTALLKRSGYELSFPPDFENVARYVLEGSCHLVLLDLGLPNLDGLHVCKEIRKSSDVPIIVVTSRDSEIDELMSMNFGADDFISKPYSANILLARIESLLRRVYKSETALLAHKGLTLNTGRSSAEFGDFSVELTKNELRILAMLIQNSGRIVSRDALIGELWQGDEFVDDNTLTVNMTRLRAKLSEIGANDYITTRRGQGYIV